MFNQSTGSLIPSQKYQPKGAGHFPQSLYWRALGHSSCKQPLQKLRFAFSATKSLLPAVHRSTNFFSVKSQIANIFSFVDHKVSVTTQPCCCIERAGIATCKWVGVVVFNITVVFKFAEPCWLQKEFKRHHHENNQLTWLCCFPVLWEKVYMLYDLFLSYSSAFISGLLLPVTSCIDCFYVSEPFTCYFYLPPIFLIEILLIFLDPAQMWVLSAFQCSPSSSGGFYTKLYGSFVILCCDYLLGSCFSHLIEILFTSLKAVPDKCLQKR